MARLKEYENKRVVLTYRNKVGYINVQQGNLAYVGRDFVVFNVGFKDVKINRTNIVECKA